MSSGLPAGYESLEPFVERFAISGTANRARLRSESTEAEEDRAARLVATIDTDTGSQQQYGDVQADYEKILDHGRRDAILARTFLAVGGAALVVGLGFFIADRVKRRPSRVRASLGGLTVRF